MNSLPQQHQKVQNQMSDNEWSELDNFVNCLRQQIKNKLNPTTNVDLNIYELRAILFSMENDALDCEDQLDLMEKIERAIDVLECGEV